MKVSGTQSEAVSWNLATPEDSEEGYLDHLWGEDESHELIIFTVPKVAPTLVYDGDNDIVLSIEDMGKSPSMRVKPWLVISSVHLAMTSLAGCG